MFRTLSDRLYKVLRWSERYTKLDMVYLARGNFWLTATRILSVGLGILLTFAFANLLTPTQFGTYKYILSVASIIGSFSLAGLGASLINHSARGNDSIFRPIVWYGALWCIPGSLVSLGFAAYYLHAGNTLLGAAFTVFACVNPILAGVGNSKSFIQGKSDFRLYALSSIPRTALPIALMIATLFLTKNVAIIASVYFLSNTLATLSLYFMILKKYPRTKDATHDPKDMAQAKTFGWHSSILGFISSAPLQIDQLLLWHYVGPAGLAVYAFAIAPVREFRNLSDNLFPIILPKFVNRSYEDLKKTLPLRVRQLYLLLIPLLIIYILAAPYLFKIFFPQYMGAVVYSQIAMLSILILPRNLLEAMLISHEKVKVRYITTITTQTVRITFVLLLIPQYGIIGALVAGFAADIVNFFLLGRLVLSRPHS